MRPSVDAPEICEIKSMTLGNKPMNHNILLTPVQTRDLLINYIFRRTQRLQETSYAPSRVHSRSLIRTFISV
jgi:hypothetical protein